MILKAQAVGNFAAFFYFFCVKMWPVLSPKFDLYSRFIKQFCKTDFFRSILVW